MSITASFHLNDTEAIFTSLNNFPPFTKCITLWGTREREIQRKATALNGGPQFGRLGTNKIRKLNVGLCNIANDTKALSLVHSNELIWSPRCCTLCFLYASVMLIKTHPLHAISFNLNVNQIKGTIMIFIRWVHRVHDAMKWTLALSSSSLPFLALLRERKGKFLSYPSCRRKPQKFG